MQFVRSLSLSITLCVSVLAFPAAASASIIGFGDFSNFTINPVNDGKPAPTVSPGTIHLTNPSPLEARSVFYNVPQTIANFTAAFTYRAVGESVGEGAAFVIQNSPAGTQAVGGSALGLGYSGINNSSAITLETASKSGLFFNGSVGAGSTNTKPSVDLLSGHAISVLLTYNGTILNESLTDTVTGASPFTTSYVVNLPAIIGSSTAYIGVTASTNNNAFAIGTDQYFSDFTFTNVPEPSPITILAVGCVLVMSWRIRQSNRA
jgi:Legume lectin domain